MRSIGHEDRTDRYQKKRTLVGTIGIERWCVVEVRRGKMRRRGGR